MISFVVVAYNSADTLKKCLQSLVRQGNSEVIVVDNDSSDNSADIAKGIRGVKLVKTGKNLGFNGGNQVGFEKSRGDIIVFLNPDAVVRAEFSKSIEKEFNNHEDVSVIGCRILNEDGSLQRTCNSYPTLRSLLYEHSGYHVIFPNSLAYRNFIYKGWDRTSEKFVDAVSGACTAIRRSALDEIGGLDTDYFLFYEEMDLSKKVEKTGGKVLFLPEPTIFHIGSTSTKKASQEFINGVYIKSRDRYIKKYHGLIYFLCFKTACIIFNIAASIKIRLSKTLLPERDAK